MYHSLDCAFDNQYDMDIYRPSKNNVPFEQFLPVIKIDVKASDPCLTATVLMPKKDLHIVKDSTSGVVTDFKIDKYAASSDPINCPI